MTAARLAFIRARLEEDRQVANGHQQWSASWHADDCVMEVRDDVNAGTVATVYRPGDLAHIARHHPARVLAEVEAKERLLKVHRRYFDEPGQACLGCAGGIPWEDCPVLRLLGLPYGDHPDYRAAGFS